MRRRELLRKTQSIISSNYHYQRLVIWVPNLTRITLVDPREIRQRIDKGFVIDSAIYYHMPELNTSCSNDETEFIITIAV
jgi:hypothetical protein